MEKGLISQKGQGRIPAPRRWIETFRNSHLELGFNFDRFSHGILSDIVSDRDQRFQAWFDKHFEEPLELDWTLAVLIILKWMGKHLAFEDSMELPAVNVVIALTENPTWNIRIKWWSTLITKSSLKSWRSSSAFNKAAYLRRLLKAYHWNRQKSYVDKRRRFLEFPVYDKFFRKSH